MAITTRDTASLLWSFLHDHDDASSVRDMLLYGASSILEAGDVYPEWLDDAVKYRRDVSPAAHTTQALCISVQDAGEETTDRKNIVEQTTIIRIYDRLRGYRNIREVRAELVAVLRSRQHSLNFGAGLGAGLLSIAYAGRSGHRYDQTYKVEFESTVWVSQVVIQEVS